MNELDKFIFILCLALGKTKAELLKTLSSYELYEWLRFYKTNPFGNIRGDLQAGIIASTIANVNRASNSKTFNAKDFMPKFDNEPQSQTQTIEQMIAGIKLYTGIEDGKEG